LPGRDQGTRSRDAQPRRTATGCVSCRPCREAERRRAGLCSQAESLSLSGNPRVFNSTLPSLTRRVSESCLPTRRVSEGLGTNRIPGRPQAESLGARKGVASRLLSPQRGGSLLATGGSRPLGPAYKARESRMRLRFDAQSGPYPSREMGRTAARAKPGARVKRKGRALFCEICACPFCSPRIYSSRVATRGFSTKSRCYTNA